MTGFGAVPNPSVFQCHSRPLLRRVLNDKGTMFAVCELWWSFATNWGNCLQIGVGRHVEASGRPFHLCGPSLLIR